MMFYKDYPARNRNNRYRYIKELANAKRFISPQNIFLMIIKIECSTT